MSANSLASETIEMHLEVVRRFREECVATIAEMAETVVACLRGGNKVCFFGNGGSAADAQHFAAEFVVRFARQRPSLPAIAFTTDTSILTACANDFGYDEVFARQVEGLCVPGDVAVGLSTSGNSPNVVRGLAAARKKGVTTFAFTGENGGACNEFADLTLFVPSRVTARIQECHLLAGHIICDHGEAALAEAPGETAPGRAT